MRVPALVIAFLLLLATPAQADLGSGRYDQPKQGFAPAWTTLHRGSPQHVGLDPAPLDGALAQVQRFTQPQPATGKPMFSGAVTLLAHDGKIVTHEPTGWAVRYSDAAGTELPLEQRVPMARDTIFDLASISKLFTSIAVMQQVEAGRVDIDQPVSRYLPEFGVNGKARITVKQLLTHTSGLEPFIPLWQKYPDAPARIKAVMDVAPKSTPGTTYVYSDLNLITLGELVLRVSGSPLDVLVRNGITAPLGLTDTGYNPPAAKLDRIAATEFQASPSRGMVRGSVHDENAWSLGGVAGHAGVFSTARELAVLGQTVLNGGSYGGKRIMRRDSVELMLTNFNTGFPGNSHGLGFELDQRWYMGALNGPGTAGHTGYTGTSLVIDRASRSIAILLSNRVHPSRNWGTINPARRVVADALGQALAVRPRHGEAWSAVAKDGTLTTRELRVRGERQRVSFDAFVDLETGDKVVLQAADGIGWRDVQTLSGYGPRRWERVSVETAAATSFRFVFVKTSLYNGRGVYIDGFRVTDHRGVLLDVEREPGGVAAVGWNSVRR